MGRNRGFTLIELMIVLAIVAILILVAVPNLGMFVQQSRMDALQNRLASAMSLARTEAIRQGEEVSVCARKSADENVDNDSCGSDWTNGWAVAIEGGNAIRVDEPPADVITVDVIPVDAVNITFLSTGLLDSDSNVCFSMDDGDPDTEDRYLQVSQFGRIRSWDGDPACEP